jgi:hypothetical protein
MRRAFVAALVLLFVFAFPADATVSGGRDGNDVKGPLDIKRIVHGHGNGDLLWHKVVMHQRWGAKDLQGANEIRFYFSNDSEDRYDEVHASVDLNDGKLGAWVFPYTEGSDYANVGPSKRIRFIRPDRRTIKIFFNKSWVDRRDRYAWSVGSDFRDRDSDGCRNSCHDYAPGHDPERVEHRI